MIDFGERFGDKSINMALTGKIGYGTVSEVLAYKVPFVFIRRDYFNEEPFLRKSLEVLVVLNTTLESLAHVALRVPRSLLLKISVKGNFDSISLQSKGLDNRLSL
jgi:hypothetical protein